MACCGWTLIKSMARWNISNIFKHKPAATLLIYTYYHTWQILRSYRSLTIQKRWHPNNEEIVFLLDMAMLKEPMIMWSPQHRSWWLPSPPVVASKHRADFPANPRSEAGWDRNPRVSHGFQWKKPGQKGRFHQKLQLMGKPWVSRRFSLVISKKKWREGETGEHF